MKYGIINHKFMLDSLRLDGNFHLSDGLVVRAHIQKSPYGIKNIGDVTSRVYCPGIFKRNYTKNGIPFLGGSDIQKNYYNCGKYLRKSTTPNHATLTIPQGCTLVTCGGTIGLTVFANKVLSQCFASQHVMRVIPSNIREGLLYAYLASKHGYALLTTNTYGTVIPTLNASNIESLPIPFFPSSFEEEIDKLIQDSSTLREDAYSFIEQAEELLRNNTSLDKLSEEDYNYFGPRKSGRSVSCFSRNIKDMGTLSFHAFNYSERTEQFKKKIKCPCVPISDVIENGDFFSTGSFPRVEVNPEHGIMLINQSDIFDTIIKGKHISKRGVKTNNLVEYGEVMIAGVGTLGEGESFCRTIFANEDLVGQLVSGEFIRMKANGKVPSGYLYTWLNSEYGFRLIRYTQSGTKLCRPIQKLLLQQPIPILAVNVMDEIDNLIKVAHSKRHKANLLEIKAIKMVEQEIDKWNK